LEDNIEMELKKVRECGLDLLGSNRIKKDSCEYGNRFIWSVQVEMGFTYRLIDD
jgi:hypothetical protein